MLLHDGEHLVHAKVLELFDRQGLFSCKLPRKGGAQTFKDVAALAAYGNMHPTCSIIFTPSRCSWKEAWESSWNLGCCCFNLRQSATHFCWLNSELMQQTKPCHALGVTCHLDGVSKDRLFEFHCKDISDQELMKTDLWKKLTRHVWVRTWRWT